MTSLANSLAGLSLLSGTAPAGISPAAPVESKAVRLARAQFTAPPVVPVWRQGGRAPEASAVLRMPSLIERSGEPGRPADVASAFTAYRALERLRALAEAGTRGSLDGTTLQNRFADGLAEVERWLASAPGDQLTFAFGRAARRAESVALPPAVAADVRGSVIVPARDAAIPGLAGNERFTLRISRPGASQTVTVDLAGLPQPPRLDAVAAAFNQAIAAIPNLNAESRFAVVRGAEGGWGLELRSGGIEEVAIGDAGAAPALMVTSGQGDAAPVALSRLSLAGGGLERSALPALAAEDRAASALQPPPREGLSAQPVLAPLSIAATVTAPDGATYAVGTSRGDLGSMLSDGADDLVLVKLDSRGRQMWQRSLGTAGSASGLSIALDPGGGVAVGGTLTASSGGDRDLLLARFDSDGSERALTTLRQLGDQDLAGMVMLGDGSALLASRQPGSPATIQRIDGEGRVVSRQALGPEVGDVRGLALDSNGDLLLLSQLGEEAALQRYAGGDLTSTPDIERFAGLAASALAVSGDGQVAVGGRRGADAEVALVGGGQVRWTDLASAGDDRLDQLLIRDGKLYAAGRTSGQLGAARTGIVDSFVARIDAAAGGIEQVQQWGRPGIRSGPVTMSLAATGASAVHRLGFSEGAINPPQSRSLADLTALRPGDRFQLRVNKGPVRTIVIEKDETAAAFAERVGRLVGRAAGKVSVTNAGGAPRIRFEPAPGQRLELLPGPEGADALAKLGLPPGSLIAPPPFDPKAPRVKPGGHYGLDLAQGLKVGDKVAAKQSLERIDAAIATVQAGFRSLYWDENKAALAAGPAKTGGGPSPYLAGQLARYRDALNRLGG